MGIELRWDVNERQLETDLDELLRVDSLVERRIDEADVIVLFEEFIGSAQLGLELVHGAEERAQAGLEAEDVADVLVVVVVVAACCCCRSKKHQALVETLVLVVLLGVDEKELLAEAIEVCGQAVDEKTLTDGGDQLPESEHNLVVEHARLSLGQLAQNEAGQSEEALHGAENELALDRLVVHSLDTLEAADESGHNVCAELGGDELHELGSVVGEEGATMLDRPLANVEEVAEIVGHELIERGQSAACGILVRRRRLADELELQEGLVQMRLIALLGRDRVVVNYFVDKTNLSN